MLTLHWHCWHCLDKVKPWLCSDCDVILFHMDYFHQSTDSWDLHRIKAQTKCMSWTRISRWSWLWTGQWILPFCVSVMWTGPHAFTEWEETTHLSFCIGEHAHVGQLCTYRSKRHWGPVRDAACLITMDGCFPCMALFFSQTNQLANYCL